MKHSFNEDRSRLIIEVTEQEQKELRELSTFQIASNQALWDFLEPLVCNSELDWIQPEQCGDLTDAPILGIQKALPRGLGKRYSVSERWGYEPYQVRSPLEDLRDNGRAVFSNAW